jgi:hypothetical protein
MPWQFVPYEETDDPTDGYYTLEAGPLYAVIEPGSQTIAVWANLDNNAVLANQTGFTSLAEAQKTAIELLEATLNRWRVEVRQASIPGQSTPLGVSRPANIAGGGDGHP